MCLRRTLTLMAVSYAYNFKRVALLAMLIFNFSSPLLHVSRLAHYFNCGSLKWVSFTTFTLVFIASRCLALPFHLLRCTLVDGWNAGIPTVAYAICNAALVTLFLLQLLWLARIIEIIHTGTVRKEFDAAGQVSVSAEVSRARATKGAKARVDADVSVSDQARGQLYHQEASAYTAADAAAAHGGVGKQSGLQPGDDTAADEQPAASAGILGAFVDASALIHRVGQRPGMDMQSVDSLQDITQAVDPSD